METGCWATAALSWSPFWGDILEAGDLDGGGGGLGGLAGASLAGVGVGGLVDVTLGHDVLEAVVHEATVAALVAVGTGAGDELLLGEGLELAGLDGVDALDGAGGGERPARAALALVLDGGDGVLGGPVHTVGGGGDVELLDIEDLLGHGGGVVAGVVLLELGVGHVGELVDAGGVAEAIGVVLVVVVDEIDVILEDVEPSHDLGRVVDLLEVGGELPPHGLILSLAQVALGEGRGDGEKRDGGEDDTGSA